MFRCPFHHYKASRNSGNAHCFKFRTNRHSQDACLLKNWQVKKIFQGSGTARNDYVAVGDREAAYIMKSNVESILDRLECIILLAFKFLRFDE